MDFNSPIFLFLFLPIFIFTYYIAPARLRPVFGIMASLLFYTWGGLMYVPLMVALTMVAYFVARGISARRQQRLSLALLWTGILLAVGLLVGFKLKSDLPYPLGLSYVTFQVIAYLIEVYTNKIKSEKNLIRFAFYILLFPKILVGPITRYSQVQNQIMDMHVEPQDVASGLRRFIIGLAKKALIADTLSKVVTPIFSLSLPDISPFLAWVVIVSYAIQLYFDFSGYTDMAIGLGRMMGLRFIENFNLPYISRSIGEFWRRWHISLSSWFRDFVFYPLERRRFKWFGQSINILIVFILTGLWHGITFNFVAWGLVHGLALVFESTVWGRKLRTLWIPLQHLYTLGVILIGWVFFRSPTLHFAVVFLRRLAGDAAGVKTLPFELTSPLPFIEPTFLVALFAGILFSLPVNQWIEKFLAKPGEEQHVLKIAYRVSIDLVLIFLMVASIAATASSAFNPGIYGAF